MIHIFLILLVLPCVFSWDQNTKNEFLFATSPTNQRYETSSIYQTISSPSKSDTTPVFGKNGTVFYVAYYDGRIVSYFINGTVEFTYQAEGEIHFGLLLSNTTSHIYATTTKQMVYCIHQNGSLAWKTNITSIPKGVPAIDRDRNVYIHTTTGSVVSLSQHGSIRYVLTNTSETIHISIHPNIIYQHMIYVFQVSGLSVYHKDTYRHLWSIPDIASNAGYYPVFSSSGVLYHHNSINTMYALLPTGNYVWKNTLPYTSSCSFLLSPDESTLYVGLENYVLLSISTVDGSIRINKKVNDPLTYSISFSPDAKTIYAPGWFGTMYAINADDLSIRWSYTIPNDKFRSSPISSQDGLYTIWVLLSGNIYIMKSSCPSMIQLCNTFVNNKCDTFASVHHCPVGNCTMNYYNHPTYPICTRCPIQCNSDQYASCDQDGRNAVCLPIHGSVHPYPWNTFYGNVQRTGATWNTTRYIQENEKARVVQTFSTGGPIRNSPIILSDGSVLFASDDTYVYRIKSNELVWKSQIDSPLLYGSVSSSPDESFVCVMTVGGFLTKLWLKNGSIAFQINTFSDAYSTPLITSNAIYVAEATGFMKRYHHNGTVSWSYKTESTVSYQAMTITPDGTQLFVSDTRSMLFSFHINGTMLWKISVGAAVSYTPILSMEQKTLYVTTADSVYGIHMNGTILYRNKLSMLFFWACVVSKDGQSLYCTPDKYVLCLNAKTGIEKWRFETSNIFDSGAVITPDQRLILAINLDGNMYGLRPDGTLQFMIQLPSHTPVISTMAMSYDGFLFYFGSDDGTLYTVRIDCPSSSICDSPAPSCVTKQEMDICFSRKCVSGYYNDLYKPSICLPCPIPSFCKVTTASSCQPDGSSSLCPLQLCIDGYYNNQTIPCTTCPPPLFCNTTTATKCITNGLNSECPLGSCQQGYYNNIASGICLKCPSNPKCLVASESCDSKTGANPVCPFGFCDSGYYNSMNKKECLLCSPALHCKSNLTVGCNDKGTDSICPIGMCVDGYYNEGSSALLTGKRTCTKCPKAFMCSSDTVMCGVDGSNPLCKANECMSGYTNNGLDSTCVAIAREYTPTQIGVMIAVSGFVVIVVIALVAFRHQIMEYIHHRKLHTMKEKMKMAWLFMMGILFPIVSVSTDIASYVSLLDRPTSYQYDLVVVYSIFIAISSLVTFVCVIINIYVIIRLLLHESGKLTAEIFHDTQKMWSESPVVIQFFFKNIPMLVLNNMILIYDNQSMKTSDSIYFITMTLQGFTAGLNLGSFYKLFEWYTQYRAKRGSIVMTQSAIVKTISPSAMEMSTRRLEI